MNSQRRTVRADSRRCIGRRQFIGAIGAAAAFGVAGCSGFSGDTGSDVGGGAGDDSSGGGGSDGNSDGATGDGGSNGDGAGSLACSDLTAGYTPYTVGDRPLIVEFDVPNVLADRVEYVDAVDMVTAVRQISTDSTAQFALSIVWMDDGNESPRGALDIEETVTEVEFNGETRPVRKMTQNDRPVYEQLSVELPHDAGDGRKYYNVMVQMEVEMARDFEVDEACAAALDEAARHVAESLRPNPDSTFDGAEQAALQG